MFHVAPYLNASPSDPQQLGRKRHIGNDVVTIVFYEGNAPLKLDFGGFIRTHSHSHVLFDDSKLTALLLCDTDAYAVVQPNRDKHATNYRISMNYKQEVVPPTPELPENGILSKSNYFREFLLTKSTLLNVIWR
jgi:RAP1 GTPase activating protein 1